MSRHRATEGCVRFADNTQLALDEMLWVTTAGAADWPGESGLATDEQGFISVQDTLQSVSHPEVFAAGDIAAVVNHPRPNRRVRRTARPAAGQESAPLPAQPSGQSL